MPIIKNLAEKRWSLINICLVSRVINYLESGEMGDGEEMSKISVRHHSSHWSQISQTSTSMDFSLRDLYFGYKRINFEWETLISWWFYRRCQILADMLPLPARGIMLLQVGRCRKKTLSIDITEDKNSRSTTALDESSFTCYLWFVLLYLFSFCLNLIVDYLINFPVML